MRFVSKEEKDPGSLQEIKIEKTSTLIEVSDYLKDSGEWPWLVMEDSRSPGDKWICSGTKGWIVYTLFKPICIRGYGIVTGNDFPKRDPKSWTFSIMDAIKEHIEGVTTYDW